jgi:hypothetical protein
LLFQLALSQRLFIWSIPPENKILPLYDLENGISQKLSEALNKQKTRRAAKKPFCGSFLWCEGGDLNSQGFPHAPQTCASADSATFAYLPHRNAVRGENRLFIIA